MHIQIQNLIFAPRNTIFYLYMDYIEFQPLINNYHRKIAKIDTNFKRYLYKQVNWDARIICIKGARGVGKTTMLLQHILDNYEDIDQTLYASLDDLWFATHSLIDLVDWADQHGLKRLYLDEVHRYELWSETLKNIYDSYPDMSIVYTSSSLLIMDNAKVDLSRRQTTYTLYGLSFREYLSFEGILHTDAIPLEDVLGHHVKQAMQITRGQHVYRRKHRERARRRSDTAPGDHDRRAQGTPDHDAVLYGQDVRQARGRRHVAARFRHDRSQDAR